MVGGIGLLGLPADARAQGSVVLLASADTGSGPAHSTYPQVIHVFNNGSANATGVTVTFTPPKGVKIDSNCLVDHMAGGVRSYTCSLGTIAPQQTVDVSFILSMTKAGDASFTADVTCDEGSGTTVALWITIS